jgi:hypothetical protein
VASNSKRTVNAQTAGDRKTKKINHNEQELSGRTRIQTNNKRQRMIPLDAFFMSVASDYMREPIVDSDQSFRSSKRIFDHMLLILLYNIGASR